MSILGVIGTNLRISMDLLDVYMPAAKAVRSRGGSVERPDEAKGLMDVLGPLSTYLRGEPYYVLGPNSVKMSMFLRRRHREDWPGARDRIVSVASRLEHGNGRADLSAEDLSILDDVSDALDSECDSLYRETRRR